MEFHSFIPNLNLQCDRKINYSPIAHFRLSDVDFKNKKSKKEQ